MTGYMDRLDRSVYFQVKTFDSFETALVSRCPQPALLHPNNVLPYSQNPYPQPGYPSAPAQAPAASSMGEARQHWSWSLAVPTVSIVVPFWGYLDKDPM